MPSVYTRLVKAAKQKKKTIKILNNWQQTHKIIINSNRQNRNYYYMKYQTNDCKNLCFNILAINIRKQITR